MMKPDPSPSTTCSAPRGMKNRSKGSCASRRSRRSTLTLTTAGASRAAAVTMAVWRDRPASWARMCGAVATVVSVMPASSKRVLIGGTSYTMTRRVSAGKSAPTSNASCCVFVSPPEPTEGVRPMRRTALRQASLCSTLLSATLALSGGAQGRGPAKQRPVPAPTTTAPAQAGADSLNNVKFRNLGPSVGGGRVAAVVGVPGDRNTYYVGAAAGGVWKTTDGGDSWEAAFKDQPPAPIGALALAPSNPNVAWVGTGEGNPRHDVVDGRGDV